MNFNILDLLKFLFAFAVIAIHTHVSEDRTTDCMAILNIVENLAVPFFFIVSGFFLGRKISVNNEFAVYKRYVHRILKLYIIWCILYLPINLYYEIVVYKFSLGFTIFDIIRGWLLVGENPYSWPLWYLLASVVAVLLIYIFRKFKCNFNIILLCSLIFFMIGWCYSTYHDLFSNFGHTEYILSEIYDKTFRTTRNGFFEGWIYIMLGVSLAKWNSRKFSLISICGGAILAFFNDTICLVPLGYGLVGTLIHIQWNGNVKIYKWLRTLSILVYLIHMMVLVALNNLYSNIDNFTCICLQVCLVY